MKIDIQVTPGVNTFGPVRAGNVYPCAGGYGRRAGNLMVIIAITEKYPEFRSNSVLMLIVDKEGSPIGVTTYGVHAIEDRCPIAFVEGLEDISLIMRPL